MEERLNIMKDANVGQVSEIGIDNVRLLSETEIKSRLEKIQNREKAGKRKKC